MQVGYGDMVPSTPWGKFCAGITMLIAIIILALPVSVLGANFTQLWTEFKACKQAEAQIQQVRREFEFEYVAL